MFTKLSDTPEAAAHGRERMLTEKDLRKLLRDECRKAGGVKLWARLNGVARSTAHDALAGRFGNAVLAKFSYERVTDVKYSKVPR